MASGIDITLGLLARTKNEAALPVLLAALDGSDAAIAPAAFTALLDRRGSETAEALLARWPALPEERKTQLVERAERFGVALRAAVVSTDSQLCASACDVLARCRDYDLLGTLIVAAETENNPNASLAAGTVLALVEHLSKELAQPRERGRRDPHLLRTQSVAALEHTVLRYGRQHQRRELLEAYLLLAGRDQSVLRQVLQDPYDKACREMVNILTHSARRGHWRLLLAFLDDAGAPQAAVQVLAHRRDEEFVRALLKKVGYEPTPPVRANLKRLQGLPWLKDRALFDALDDACQHAAVQAAAGSNVPRHDIFDFLRDLLQHGKPGGRRAAAKALAGFHGAEANALVLDQLGDDDPQVQAALLPQLRDRSIPGALTRLIAALDSPHAVIREAARNSLGEFTFRRYVGSFDSLDDDVRRTSGRLVKKADPQALPLLLDELRSPVRARRLRALTLAIAMEMAVEAEEEILARMQEVDHLIRAAAVRALAASGTPLARTVLREALLDRSATVQRTAEECLLELAESAALHLPDPNATPVAPASDLPAGLMPTSFSAE